MKISQKEFDSILKGMGAIAKVEVQRAVAPLHTKIAALEVENAVLREAVKDLREKQALAEMTPAEFRRRYDAVQ